MMVRKNIIVKSVIVFFVTIVFCGFFGTVEDASAAWGPDRRTFTWDDPAPYATFNSITNNPTIGDERNFVRIRKKADGEKFGDSVELEVGQTYEVYIYYHNNADAHEVGQKAIGIAEGSAVKSSFPSTVKAGTTGWITGEIFAADTNPLSVYDDAAVTTKQDIYLRYVSGTAIIHNGGNLNGASIGPDYLFGDGALLGYNKFSGLLPGCNQYAGYITYDLFVDQPNFSIDKVVVNEAEIYNVGDVVTFKIRYENIGTMNQNRVVVKDILPEGLEYIQGKTMLYNNNTPNGKSVNDDIISDHGMNIGNYAGGSGWAEVVYQAVVKDTGRCTFNLTNKARISTSDGDKTDSVTISIQGSKEYCEEYITETCEANPDLPECQSAETCETNPDLPECQSAETCETNPDLPECQSAETCETNPDMEGCTLPKTGPAEIVMASVIVLGLGIWGIYYIHTKKNLSRVKASVLNGASDKGDNDKSDKDIS